MLQIKLLGSPSINLGDQPISLSIQKAHALIYYLALQPQPVDRAILVDLLWSDVTEDAARRSLRVLLTKIRPLFSPYLTITRRTIGLNWQQSITCDVHQFAAAEQSAAIAIYSGDLLSGFQIEGAREFELWLFSERERLRLRYMSLLHGQLDAQLARSDWRMAVQTARQLLDCDNWDEGAWRHLMYALAQHGERAAALAAFEQCRMLLAEDVGVAVSAETNALAERIRGGEFDSKQADVTALHNPQPPLNLPAATTRYVGHSAEIVQIATLLTVDDCRLLTLHGPGGIGKSRLAIQAARNILRHHPTQFADGIYFAPLAGASSREAILIAIGSAIGYRFGRSQNRAAQLSNYLSSRKLLLVLDNFEQLVEESGLIADLLKAAPNLRVIVTSRELLNLYEEWQLPLDGLPIEEGSISKESAQYLFEQRARRVNLAFTIDDNSAERSAIDTICRMVEGMPLAIELAAANIRSHSCSEIAAEIVKNADFLVTQMRNVPKRQRSLHAVFNYSWQLLAPPLQPVLQQLTVFHNWFSPMAAEAICGATPTQLADLVDKSLLIQSPDGRLRFHSLMRQFSAEIAPIPDPVALRQQHATWFARMLAEQVPRMQGRDETTTLQSLLPDEANIRAAWKHAISNRHIDLLQLMFAGIDPLFRLRGQYDICRTFFAEAEPLLNHDAIAPTVRSDFLNRYASTWQYVDRIADGPVMLLQQALALAEQVGDARQIAIARHGLGNSEVARGHYDVAITHFEEVIVLAEQSQAHNVLADCLQMFAYVLSRRGTSDDALAMSERALSLQRDHGGDIAIASTLTTLGNLYNNLGLYAKAAVVFAEVLERTHLLRHQLGIASAHTGLFASLMPRGEIEQATEHARKALDAYVETGDQWGVAIAQHNLGMVYEQRGEWQVAFEWYRDSAETYIASNAHNTGLANSQLACGDAALELGQLEITQTYHRAGLKLAWKLQSMRFVAKGFVSFAKWAVVADELTLAALLLDHVEEMDTPSAETHAAISTLRHSTNLPISPSMRSTQSLVMRLLRVESGVM